MTKLKPAQLELLNRLAQNGWDNVDGVDLTCARGLYRRRDPLVVVEHDEEYEQKKGCDSYVARLTTAGAMVVQREFGWLTEEAADGSWEVKRNGDMPVRTTPVRRTRAQEILDQIRDDLEKINAEKLRAVELVAARIREEFVVPICKKHGLRFTSGTDGDYFFYDPKAHHESQSHHMSSVEDALAADMEFLTDVFNMLYLDVDTSCTTLGDFVESVTDKDQS